MAEKIVFHIDVNSAFLSWESVRRVKRGESDLREIPAAVGGDRKKRHGVILAKSIPAKRYGIHTGESIMEALKKCPQLYLVPPDFGLYSVCSRAFITILKEYSPVVEQVSIDEAFVDMTGMEKLFGPPIEVAEKIKDRIFEELGFTVNVGISTNKLLAKMASDFEKPGKVHTLYPEEIAKKMWPLPVGELYSVGRSTVKQLYLLGIRTIGDLAKADPELLKRHLKKHGELIWNFANGRDVSIVEEETAPNKGYGNSTTIAFDVTDESVAKMVLLSLTETVASRLRQAGVKAESVSVSIRDADFHNSSHQMLLMRPTDITYDIYEAVCQLFDELWDGEPIRLLGVSTGRLVEKDAPEQLSFFDEDLQKKEEKLKKLDAAIDTIRSRYGVDAVKRAAFVKAPVDHVAGKHLRAQEGGTKILKSTSKGDD